MARLSPSAAAQKWSTNLGAAAPGIEAQVRAVTEAPGLAAARQKSVWLQRVTASADKWARRVSAVSLQDWQDSMITKGIPRIAQGATAAIPKMEQFMSEFLPYVDQGVAKIKAMPKGGVEAGIARSNAMIRHNAAFVRKG